MSLCGSSTFGQKIRVNVVANIGEHTVGKFLVCIDEDSSIEDLSSKIRGQLAKGCIEGHLLRLTNTQAANLCAEERVGDALRDAEEVIAVMCREPVDPRVRQQMMAGASEVMNFVNSQGGARDLVLNALVADTPPTQIQENISANRPNDLTCSETMLPIPRPKGDEPEVSPMVVPGPAELFVDDMQDPLPMKPGQDSVRPWSSATARPRGDWSVDGLTPALKEYITTRFKEEHMSTSKDAADSYISVAMRPHARIGSASAMVPIHYSIARVDVIEFERLCRGKIEMTRMRLDHFVRCQEVLTGLVEKGAQENDYAPNMLPYRYRDNSEFESLLLETDDRTFGQIEGFRPMFLVDTSGAVGESLVYIRAALKRMLYSFFVGKSKFNLVKYSPQGRAVLWANGMVPPTAQVLREAEEWFDSLKPIKGTPNVLDGVQLSLAPLEVDMVYVLTAGFPKRCDVEYVLKGIRSMNVRDIPIHIVGVGCDAKAELDLRRLADENHGSFRHKQFSETGSGSLGITSASGTSGAGFGSTATLPKIKAGDGDDNERMTIGGQLNILEVMVEEQETQVTDWLEEQKCANRLLLTTATQQAVPEPKQHRVALQRAALANNARQMGMGQPRLQELLEAKSEQGAGRPPARPSSARPARPGQQGPVEARRPSVANPWDRPGAPLRPSQFLAKNAPGPGAAPPRARSSSRGPSRSAR